MGKIEVPLRVWEECRVQTAQTASPANSGTIWGGGKGRELGQTSHILGEGCPQVQCPSKNLAHFRCLSTLSVLFPQERPLPQSLWAGDNQGPKKKPPFVCTNGILANAPVWELPFPQLELS